MEAEKHLDAVVTELIRNKLHTAARLMQKRTYMWP